MRNLSQSILTLACVSLVGSAAIINNDKVHASERHNYQRHHYLDTGNYRWHRSNRAHRAPYVIHRGPIIVYPNRRMRRFHNTIIYRPHGHWYPGYGYYHADNDAFVWLSFTAITLKLLDNLSEDQQRAHEAAQVRATTAPVGEPINWNQGAASGSVTTTRDGTSTSGRYCREFQHEITVEGKREDAYGIACRQSDGSWEIVSTGKQ